MDIIILVFIVNLNTFKLYENGEKTGEVTSINLAAFGRNMTGNIRYFQNLFQCVFFAYKK